MRLKVGGGVYEQPFEIRKDPRITASQQDLEAQCALMVKIRDRLSEVTDAVNRIRVLRGRIEEGAKGLASRPEALAAAARALEKLLTIEGTLTRQMRPNPMFLPPKTLNIRLAALTLVVQSADAAPPKQAHDVFDSLSARVETQLKQLEEVTNNEVAAFLKMTGGATPQSNPAGPAR